MVYTFLEISRRVLDFIQLKQYDNSTQNSIILSLENALVQTLGIINELSTEERYKYDFEAKSKHLFQAWTELAKIIKPFNDELASHIEKEADMCISPKQFVSVSRHMKNSPSKRFEYPVMLWKMKEKIMFIENQLKNE